MSQPDQTRKIGILTSGSLSKGVEVKLDGAFSTEDVAVGQYVAIKGDKRRFLGMITDVSLGTSDEMLKVLPPDMSDPLVRQIVSGTNTFGLLHVLPQLTIGSSDGVSGPPQPARTVPAHFSEVFEASDQDVETVFGQEDEKHIYIGTPLDMESKVCLDVKRFVERSNGIFGKSGTGKTFLTRILLSELVQRSAAANLIFDMHNEYGWAGTSEDGHPVKGLKQIFTARVAVFTLDEENSRSRGVSTDFTVKIGYGEIEPEDIEMLTETLNITERGMDAVHELAGHYGQKKWLESFLSKSDKEVQEDLKERAEVQVGTLRALKLSLSRLKRFLFLSSDGDGQSVPNLLNYLNRKINVVLEFGRYRDDLAAYILVANVLTRRIHQKYVDATEKSLGDRAKSPTPLIITIEEAHKFLTPKLAGRTIFGTIAREMRKYNVTLLVIDQRPSSIHDEIMSQIGTKICCLLDDEKDVDAVLTGVSGKSELRSVLARLETKQQSLIFGHSVPMPVVVRVKDWGTAESYKRLGPQVIPEGKELDDIFKES